MLDECQCQVYFLMVSEAVEIWVQLYGLRFRYQIWCCVSSCLELAWTLREFGCFGVFCLVHVPDNQKDVLQVFQVKNMLRRLQSCRKGFRWTCFFVIVLNISLGWSTMFMLQIASGMVHAYTILCREKRHSGHFHVSSVQHH